MGQPAKIMVIRHAEKPDGKFQGVTEKGIPDKHSLIVRGWQRAGALVALFDPARGPLQDPQLAIPDVVYASAPDDEEVLAQDSANKSNGVAASDADASEGSHSRRPLETITPLAERLDVDPNLCFTKGEEDRLVQCVLKTRGVILISWQHEKIPTIANLIVASNPPETPIPQSWPGDRFDVVWIFTPPAAPTGRWGFAQVPQDLLAGDKNSVITPATASFYERWEIPPADAPSEVHA